MIFPNEVKLVEVGPRDGLQNEPEFVATTDKLEFIRLLSETGLKVIEATSFVSPQKIPQMKDHFELMQQLSKKETVSYPVLIPNLQGLMRALESGIEHIAVFGSPSETFSQKNIHCSVAESLSRFSEVTTLAKQRKLRIRGYISCVLGCPYEGKISKQAVAEYAQQLLNLGCEEISLGDTIGVGTPHEAQQLIDYVATVVPREKIAVHFHDTYGQALANIYACLEKGIKIIDASVSGLGGCPYAKGASGNVATEDVLYMLEGLGIKTGVNLSKLIEAGRFICKILNRPSRSKTNIASVK